ncbi:MAG TPA: NADH:ubiquinone oxidoreductase [Lentisphaeria bacterium]|nr:MAG: NADH:ubiquinone oxidoreductase [Lentisphaerae bacterium GWF2_38_69]HBM14794.1 NADH:ubiquinone oxidoreductase [Lentisphaeria bacterium]
MGYSKNNISEQIAVICKDYGNDRTKVLDILRKVQDIFSCVPDESLSLIANEISLPRVEVHAVASFYAFLTNHQRGKFSVKLCNDIIDMLSGAEKVAKAFEEELGIKFGEMTKDGMFSLEYTACIGMSDQAPAAIINDLIYTNLSPDRAREIIVNLKQTMDVSKLAYQYGDGNNSHPSVRAMVRNQIRKPGEVIFGQYNRSEAIKKAISLSPAEVIREIKASRLRGRGGAGFPTGMKWEFTRNATADKKTIICNADEGEPGTFKDRVILTERTDMLFEGMTIGAYAIGAEEGIIYLRAEYSYLKKYLEEILQKRRDEGLLGKDIVGKKDFNFDIRIQMGAGSYVCGEETALISSCEGLRGDPKNRPPFPAQKGYKGTPTSVNNVETFCCVVQIINKGPAWFASMGTKGSTGTKLLSICGDCSAPGVYEVNYGISIEDLLKMAGAQNTLAVQVGGPSGFLIAPSQFKRIICYDDLATGGSIMIFNNTRNILEVVDNFVDFFIDESCGYCTPCRVGNVLLKKKLNQIMEGLGEKHDIEYLQKLGTSIQTFSRCGLGQTSPRTILSSIEGFRNEYDKLLKIHAHGFAPTFDINKALGRSEEIIGRKSVIFEE